MLKLLLKSLGARRMFNTKTGRRMNLCFCVPQFAGVRGEMRNLHNLHRTGHIQICKQDIAG